MKVPLFNHILLLRYAGLFTYLCTGLPLLSSSAVVRNGELEIFGAEPRELLVWSAAVLVALAVAAAAALWIYYGTAVFFEMIAAGIAACF